MYGYLYETMSIKDKCYGLFHSILVIVALVMISYPAAGQKQLRILLSVKDQLDLFYKENSSELHWFKNNSEIDGDLKNELIRIFREESVLNGLDSLKYLSMLPLKTDFSNLSSVEAFDYDRKFTNAALTYFLDLYQGDKNINKLIGSDEVSGKYEERDVEFIVHLLSKSNSVTGLNSMVWSLGPHQRDYTLLKAELKKQLYLGDSKKAGAVRTSLNCYRWFSHFHFDKLVVVNIPSAELKYYESDSLKLDMAVVVGKPSTMTPRFVTYCDQVILYPYWNVPRSIAVNEILPVCKKA
ncbi:L,D-transpeptidase scaffold domain-containing protein [Niabella hibiscisoli]|uniref:L,D-transpeptidase family protein n=1 Tax=Niabella hibiscisoli TaxID=1825928 RepID=UPI0021D424DE|nr:L,D-transpeptidase family protein [Niabella hibiscisoli]